jgi:hypothetical protein
MATATGNANTGEHTANVPMDTNLPLDVSEFREYTDHLIVFCPLEGGPARKIILLTAAME